MNCGMFTLLIVQQWCDSRDVSCGFLRKWSACRKVLFIPRRTRMIGCKEACRSETVMHVFEVRDAGDDVIVSIKRVETEPIANPEFDPSTGHELHQPHGILRRHCMLVAATLNSYHRTDPARRDSEAERTPPR